MLSVGALPARACPWVACWLICRATLHSMWFETEEEFFAAASRCAALYFLPERRVVFREKSLQPSSGGAECQSALYRVIQRGSEREILADNTGGALYDAAIVLSRYLAAREAESMQGKTVLVCL